MAKTYRQMLLAQRGEAVEEKPAGAFRIRFYFCLCLFAAYILLDYSKATVYSIDSERICQEIGRDMSADFNLEDAVSQVMNSIWVSEELPEEP
jgi:hypothetical protein